MPLFKKKEKKEATSCCCDCGCCADEPKQDAENKGGERIKVLGSGCAKCQSLEEATKEALKDMGLSISVEHVTDFAEIARYGVMSTPALAVDGKVVSYGKVLKKEEIKELIEKEL